MGETTKIQWCDHTFNPWRGCTKVHTGCANCYAETNAKRNTEMFGVWGERGTRVVASESMWRQPLKWNREAEAAGVRRRVFCASLADVFEDWSGPMVSADGTGRAVYRSDADPFSAETMQDARERLFRLIDSTPWLDWLLVTKRPQNVRRMWPENHVRMGPREYREWLKNPSYNKDHRFNAQILTSISDQQTAQEMVQHLLKCRDLAPVLGLSIEPLLGPINLRTGVYEQHDRRCRGTTLDGIDWVIVGGESGPNARPCNIAWIRSIVQQCKAAGVPCFVKQWGSRPVACGACDCGRIEHGRCHQECPRINPTPLKLKDKKGGDMAEWSLDMRVREYPRVPTNGTN